MKQFNPPHNRFTILTGITLLCGLLTMAPWSEATAVGTWSYPTSEAERIERENILEEQLLNQENSYNSQFEIMAAKKGALTRLEEKIKVARKTINLKKQPLNDAIAKYRQVQRLSLLDPMVSTEPQRMELIRVKKETVDTITIHKNILQDLVEQIPEAKSHVEVAVEKQKYILREIDSLIKHRDAVRELVFLRTVAD
jgi:hypothetical protein